MKYISMFILFALLSACGSVPLATDLEDKAAKRFKPPIYGQAGLYVYRRHNPVGATTKMDLWLNGECLGETSTGVYFYHELPGNQRHTLTTEAEFSDVSIDLDVKSGEIYFVEQEMQHGIFIYTSTLIEEWKDEGKNQVSMLKMAKKGTCNSQFPS